MKTPTRDSDKLVQKFKEKVAEHLQVIGSRPANDEQAAEQLRAYHAIGQAVVNLVPNRAAYGRNVFNDFAQAIDRSSNWLYKARKFALEYNERQLNTLCRKAEHIRIGHVPMLVSQPPAKRKKSTESIVQNGWSPQQFRRELHKGLTEPSNAGRKPMGAESLTACVDRIHDLADQWLRFCRKVLDAADSPLADYRDEIKPLLAATKRATAVMADLHDHCKAVADKPPKQATSPGKSPQQAKRPRSRSKG